MEQFEYEVYQGPVVKTNKVVSKRFGKISNVDVSDMLLFFFEEKLRS